MELTLPISSILIIALGSLGIGIAIITSSILILKQKANNVSNKLLIVFLILFALTLLNEVLTTSGLSNRIKDLYFIPIYFSLSLGPLFYLFIKTKINHGLLKNDVLHLILPFAQFLTYLVIGFRSIEVKSALWANPIFRQWYSLETILFPISLILYGYLTLFLLHKSKEKSYFWYDDLKRWLRSMAQIFFAVAILETILSVGEFLSGERFGDVIYLFRILGFVILILWVSYHIVKIVNPSTIYKTGPKAKDSMLSMEELSLLKSKLIPLFEEDKIHLNSDLNLNILAEYLKTTPKKCSHLLRTEFAQNFNQFVNSYRINEFKAMVKANDHKNLTLLSLAYAAGFQSKSTFNRTFKSIEGKTPSEYINSIDIDRK